MTETPTLDDISIEDSQEIGATVAELEKGERIRATNNVLDRYVIGRVVEVYHRPNGEKFHRAIVEQPNGKHVEIHANWRDITPSRDDQETPFTGLIIEPFNDTAPAVTDIEVL